MLVCLHFKQDSFIQFCRERHQFCKNSVILFLCILVSQHYTWHYRHILATLHTLTSAILFSLPLLPVWPENNRKKQIKLFWRPPFVNQEGYQFLFSDYIFAAGSPLHIGCFNTMPCKKWRTNEVIYFPCIYLYFRHPFIHSILLLS